ncbi:MAG: sulfotransferase [Silicimonas sp.]|nr:sulfotransferase [Silicimonas sp.]
MSRLDAPIFLLCSERSGSNLITKMFDAHPSIAAPGTSHLFRTFSQISWRYEAGDRTLKEDIVRAFRNKVGSWQIDDQSDRELLALMAGAPHAAEMIAALMEAELSREGKTAFFVKENFVYQFIPFAEAAAKNPRYIFLVRDPRNMAASWQEAAVLRGGIVRAARRWVDDQMGFLRTCSWMSGRRKIARLTYESLVADPSAALAQACEDLDLDYDSAMLDFANKSRSAAMDAQRSSVWKNIAKPVFANDPNKFASVLNDDQITYIETLCGPLMTEFGYETSKRIDKDSSEFQQLETDLEQVEPWTKSAYDDLPLEERRKFEAWSANFAELTKLT